LPTVRGLAKELAVNRNTVQKVYAALERAGLLVTRVGSGSYVASGKVEPVVQLASATRDRFHQVIWQGFDEGLTAHDLRLIFESQLIESVRQREVRATQMMTTRKRFAERFAYGPSRLK
jgi:GntR family transcriptional regulator